MTLASPSLIPSVAVVLRTPPIVRVVPDGVFDAFGWCASETLEWRRPSRGCQLDVDVQGDNPPGMAFVLRAPCDFLPKELARLHAFGLGLTDQWALAPYAIDDATDELFTRRARPQDWLWLAADNLAALAWGLHDWAHFHSHGPFTARAWTELQCDASALAWLWLNRATIGIDEARWERVRRAFVNLSESRFTEEGARFDAGLLEAGYLRDVSRMG